MISLDTKHWSADTGLVVPRKVHDDVARIFKAYGKAEGVQATGEHGGLIMQFTGPSINERASAARSR